MSTDESDRHRVRASDAEREGFATIVRAAMTEGRLTLEEGEERIGKVYAAAYRDELPPLTDDLPDGGRRAVYDTPEIHEQVRRQARRFFAGRLGAVAAVTALFVTLGALTHGHFFWPIVPIVLWVLILNRRMMMHRWAAAHWVARSGNSWSGGRWSGGPGAGGPAAGDAERRAGRTADPEGWGR